MAVLSSQEVRITTTAGEELTVLDVLQHLGTTELIENANAPQLSDVQRAHETQLLESIDYVNKAIDLLADFKEKQSVLAALTDDRLALTTDEVREYHHRLSDIVSTAERLTVDAHRKEQLHEQIALLQDTITKVTPFKDIELHLFGDFRYVRFIPFYVKAERRELLIAEAERLLPDMVLESIDKVGDEYVYVAAVARQQYEEAMSYLVDHATLITIHTTVHGSFKDVYQASQQALQVAQAEYTTLQQGIADAAKTLNDLMVARDILKSDLQKIFSLHAFTTTESLSTISVLIDPRRIPQLQAAIDQIPGATVVVLEQYNHDKIVMRNNSFFRNFEIVTKMMGLPKGNSVDPTPFLAVFFVLMFGLALSEAGYAVVIAVVTGLLLLRKDLKTNVRSLMTVIFFCGLSTIVIGAIFGSWFGVTPEDITDQTTGLLPHTTFFTNIGLTGLLQKLQLINPIKQVVTLMMVMGVLGLVHLCFGLIINFFQHLKRGEAAEGFYASISWLIFLGLVIVSLLASQGILGQGLADNVSYIVYLLGAYTLLMVFFVGREAESIFGKFAKGLFDLFFGIIGYISDTLSYTRLVALGLATGIIAAVVNTLAELAGGGLVAGGGWKIAVGYLIMAVIFIGGHIFNIALNVLGSYITVGRLHFVEFFNKFFESGGTELAPFQPVQESTKIIHQ